MEALNARRPRGSSDLLNMNALRAVLYTAHVVIYSMLYNISWHFFAVLRDRTLYAGIVGGVRSELMKRPS